MERKNMQWEKCMSKMMIWKKRRWLTKTGRAWSKTKTKTEEKSWKEQKAWRLEDFEALWNLKVLGIFGSVKVSMKEKSVIYMWFQSRNQRPELNGNLRSCGWGSISILGGKIKIDSDVHLLRKGREQSTTWVQNGTCEIATRREWIPRNPGSVTQEASTRNVKSLSLLGGLRQHFWGGKM